MIMNSTEKTSRISANVRVTSVRSRGSGGGCIFGGKIVDGEGDAWTGGQSLVVVASYDVISDGDVQKGEVWHVSGRPRSYTYAVNGYRREEEQLVVDTATLVRPSGGNIVAALADHPDFSGIGYVKARKLWDAFGDELYRILDAGDVETLRRVLSLEVAEKLVDQWRTWDRGTVVRWLDCLAIPRAIGRKVVAFYGTEARRKIEEDPYRLIAFEADWSRVDEIARGSLGIPGDDPRRLSGGARGGAVPPPRAETHCRDGCPGRGSAGYPLLATRAAQPGGARSRSGRPCPGRARYRIGRDERGVRQERDPLSPDRRLSHGAILSRTVRRDVVRERAGGGRRHRPCRNPVFPGGRRL